MGALSGLTEQAESLFFPGLVSQQDAVNNVAAIAVAMNWSNLFDSTCSSGCGDSDGYTAREKADDDDPGKYSD